VIPSFFALLDCLRGLYDELSPGIEDYIYAIYIFIAGSVLRIGSFAAYISEFNLFKAPGRLIVGS
jgi:hypothetical protein